MGAVGGLEHNFRTAAAKALKRPRDEPAAIRQRRAKGHDDVVDLVRIGQRFQLFSQRNVPLKQAASPFAIVPQRFLHRLVFVEVVDADAGAMVKIF